MRAGRRRADPGSIKRWRRAAMWASEVATEIARPPADVYRYLADFTRHREWSSARLESLELLTGGPLRAGSEFRAQETAPGRVVTMSRVTALEPGRRI